MRTHFKRVVKRNSRQLPEHGQQQDAEGLAKAAERLHPIFEKTIRDAQQGRTVYPQLQVDNSSSPEALRYRQLDQLQHDWALAAGKLPEMVRRSMYGSIVELALRGRGGNIIKVDMRTGRIWTQHDWIVQRQDNVVELGTLPMSGAELIAALRIAMEA